MKVQIKKWGNSLAVRIRKVFAEESNIKQASVVNVSVVDGKLVIEPVTRSALYVGANARWHQLQEHPRRNRFWPTSWQRGVVMPTTAFPERGDVIWLSLDSRIAHEQAGRRPTGRLARSCQT